jgi:hypothetical protein
MIDRSNGGVARLSKFTMSYLDWEDRLKDQTGENIGQDDEHILRLYNAFHANAKSKQEWSYTDHTEFARLYQELL